MSRKLLLASLLAVLSLPTIAEAQPGFGIAGGIAQPVGDFGNYAVAGPTFSGLLNLSIPLAPVGFRFEGTISQFDHKPAVVSTGGEVRMLSATANAMLSTPGLIGPYLIGGVGVYRSTGECNGCTTRNTTKTGFNGGLGLRLGLLGLSAYAEARFHYIPGANSATISNLTTSTSFIPLTVGLTF